MDAKKDLKPKVKRKKKKTSSFLSICNIIKRLEGDDFDGGIIVTICLISSSSNICNK